MLKNAIAGLRAATFICFLLFLAACGSGSSSVPFDILTNSLNSGVVGTPYSATITAANGQVPYAFTVSSGSLPAGISLSSGGILSGTPTAAATSTFTVLATDARAQQASQTYHLTITPLVTNPLTITTTSIPGGQVGVAYTATIAATNGTLPYTFSVSSGTLPPGLSLSAAGAITGSPTTAGTSTFILSVVDAANQRASESYTVTIAAAGASPITFTTATVPPGTVNTPYYMQIAAIGGATPYLYTESGSLPSGLAVSPVGVLSGTPTVSGTFNFTVTITDMNQASASKSYSLVIAPAVAALSIPTSSLPGGAVNVAYSSSVVAANGTAPYTFAISSGTPPAGLTLSAAGVLAGTPTTGGSSTFTVTVTDARSQTASATYTVAISAGGVPTLTLGPASLPAAILNAAYTTPLQVGGGTAPYTVVQNGGGLPPGITLSTAGVLSGTPGVLGAYTFSAKVVDSSSPAQVASANFTLSVVTATVAVDTTSVLATVPQSFFGLHTSVYDTSLNDTAKLPALLQTTGITTLRYPGGSYSDRYHWAQFSETPLYGSTPPACGQIMDGYLGVGADFGNFVKTLLATNTTGLITINYGTSVANSTASVTAGTTGVLNRCSEPNTAGQPQEAAAWVAYANGLPTNTQTIGPDATGFDWKTVGFWAGLRAASPLAADDGYNFLRIGHAAPVGIHTWEVGNEMYYNGWSDNRNFEADLHAPYIYPNGYSGTYLSRAGLAALSPTAYGTNAASFSQAMKAVDPTIQIGVDFASPGATDPIQLSWNPDLAQAACAASSFDFVILHYYPGTYNAVQPGELLSLPQADLPRVLSGIKANLAQYCPANLSTPFWLTETSPNGNLANGFPPRVTGLFALNEYLTSLANGISNIDWLELHNGTYLDENENPGPAYYGIQLAHLLAGVGDSLVSAQSSSINVLSFATLKANGQKGVLLVNASASGSATVQVTVSGATLGTTATEYSYGISTSQSSTALTGTSFAIPASSFPVTVPAYTAVELIIP
jgi:hypothetical protein